MAPSMSRREVVGAAAAVPPLMASGRAAAQGHDPRRTAEGQVKLEAALDGGPAFWTYSGVIYGVRPGLRPLPLLGVAGGQSSWATPGADGGYTLRGAIVTFFRDPQSGAFLDTFDNPLTGRRNRAAPNVLTGGAMVFPGDGSSARAAGEIKPAVVAPGGFGPVDPARALGAVRWSLLGPSVMLMTDRSWAVAVQPQLEAQTKIADRAGFFDPRVRRLSAAFSATTIVPWMAWMEMGDTPGHLVWHSSGQKVFAMEDVPADYRRHAGDRLDLLTTAPKG